MAAPLYYVSPSQLEAIVPFETTGSVARIQVVNNVTQSNYFTTFVYASTAGIFTQLQNGQTPGLGYIAAVHNATGQVVTPSNPAQPGEYIQVFATGLGEVTPAVQDGALAPPSLTPSIYCLNQPGTTCLVAAYIGSGLTEVPASVVYAGLAPTFAGLYQINLRIPSTGAPTGDQPLQICGPDSCTSEPLISIGSGGLSAAVREQPSASPRSVPRTKARVPFATRPISRLRQSEPAP